MSVQDGDVDEAVTMLARIQAGTVEVDAHIDNLLTEVQAGNIDTSQGLSFLEMKNQTMLSYLTNLAYVMLRKVSGHSINNDTAVFRLAELRTVLEKIRPIDQKLKYQIDKLVRTAALGAPSESDPLRFRANPDDLLNQDEDDSESDEESDKEENKSKTYVPPKVTPVHYDGDLTQEEKKERQVERNKKRAMSSSVVQELQAQYGDAPVEIKHAGDHQRSWESKRIKDVQDHEEKYFMRLSMSKKDKTAMRQSRNRSGMEGFTNFGDFSALIGNDDFPTEGGNTKKRKAQGKGKKGKKGFKKRKK